MRVLVRDRPSEAQVPMPVEFRINHRLVVVDEVYSFEYCSMKAVWLHCVQYQVNTVNRLIFRRVRNLWGLRSIESTHTRTKFVIKVQYTEMLHLAEEATRC
jgi:hypothetical protein